MQTHALFASFVARARAFERANHRDTGMLDGVKNGQLLNIGAVYKFQAHDSLMGVAGRFRTTIKSLLDLNPDILDPDAVAAGQEICLVPCTH